MAEDRIEITDPQDLDATYIEEALMNGSEVVVENWLYIGNEKQHAASLYAFADNDGVAVVLYEITSLGHFVVAETIFRYEDNYAYDDATQLIMKIGDKILDRFGGFRDYDGFKSWLDKLAVDLLP